MPNTNKDCAMVTIKAAGVMTLKELLKEKKLEGSLLAQLEPDLAEQFAKVMSVHRLPMDHAELFCTLGAKLLFPKATDPCRLLGQAQARHDLKGVYKYVVRLLSVSQLIQQTVRLWKLYYEKGVPHVEEKEDHHKLFVVENYPDWPVGLRAMSTGYIEEAVAMTGAKRVRIVHLAGNPAAWVWDIQWE